MRYSRESQAPACVEQLVWLSTRLRACGRMSSFVRQSFLPLMRNMRFRASLLHSHRPLQLGSVYARQCVIWNVEMPPSQRDSARRVLAGPRLTRWKLLQSWDMLLNISDMIINTAAVIPGPPRISRKRLPLGPSCRMFRQLHMVGTGDTMAALKLPTLPDV